MEIMEISVTWSSWRLLTPYCRFKQHSCRSCTYKSMHTLNTGKPLNPIALRLVKTGKPLNPTALRLIKTGKPLNPTALRLIKTGKPLNHIALRLIKTGKPLNHIALRLVKTGKPLNHIALRLVKTGKPLNHIALRLVKTGKPLNHIALRLVKTGKPLNHIALRLVKTGKPLNHIALRLVKTGKPLNPIALRLVKTLWNFGQSEFNRVKSNLPRIVYHHDDRKCSRKNAQSNNNPKYKITSTTLYSIITPFEALEISCFWKYYGKWSICSFEKCSIFHNIFKSIQNFTWIFLLFFFNLSKNRKWCHNLNIA